jgi:ariadne-1
VTRNYFENLVRALENGLSDVDTNVACSKSSMKNGGSSKGRGGRGKAPTTRMGGSSKSGDGSIYWSCEQCTYANVKSATRCEMCNQQRR